MSTTRDPSGDAGEMAEQQASALLGSDVREGYADIGDVRLHYVEAGEGPLVVLLHGFPEFWYGWRLQIKPLAGTRGESVRLRYHLDLWDHLFRQAWIQWPPGPASFPRCDPARQARQLL
jgi:pimeloyl-ACP methyl ester carboxylesterase